MTTYNLVLCSAALSILYTHRSSFSLVVFLFAFVQYLKSEVEFVTKKHVHFCSFDIILSNGRIQQVDNKFS